LHFNKYSLKTYFSISEFKTKNKTIVTIGTFDGVHIGHNSIIKKLIKASQNTDLETVILSFFPHPRMVLNSYSEVKLLNTIDEKSILIEKLGLQHLIIHPFDETFANLSAEEFVLEILVKKLNIKKIIIGHDHRFGKNRSANIDDLILFGKKYNFEVEQISAQEIEQVSVSSTKIREALYDGNIILANKYLGYNYFLTGNVIKGRQLGRTINFPTANIAISENFKLIPKNGVYVVKSFLNNEWVFGMMNIGIKPTFEEHKLTIEVHFLDFNTDLYQQQIQVSILHFIRDEQKFNGIESLKLQLQKDKIETLDFIKNLKTQTN
jgi:riboflavin kinase / FMN adenylyltransferase